MEGAVSHAGGFAAGTGAPAAFGILGVVQSRELAAIRTIIGSELEMVGAIESGRLAALLATGQAHLHPDFTTVFVDSTGQRSEWPGTAGLVEGWKEWLEAWSTYRLHIEDVLEAGEDRVFVPVKVTARTRRDDVEMTHRPAAVFAFEDGKVRVAAFYLEREHALEAAGLRPDDLVAGPRSAPGPGGS